MTAPANPVEAVRERLGENGERWAQGTRPTRRNADVCLIEALAEVAACEQWELATDVILQTIVEQFPGRLSADDLMLSATVAVGRWNDHPATVWPEPALVAEKAAQEYEARQVSE